MFCATIKGMDSSKPDRQTFADRLKASQDVRVAVFASVFVFIPVITLASFYFGTINRPDQAIDLRAEDLSRGFKYALGGLGIGAIVALLIATVYAKAKVREEAIEDAAHHH